jgi:hypothetical protein
MRTNSSDLPILDFNPPEFNPPPPNFIPPPPPLKTQNDAQTLEISTRSVSSVISKHRLSQEPLLLLLLLLLSSSSSGFREYHRTAMFAARA